MLVTVAYYITLYYSLKKKVYIQHTADFYFPCVNKRMEICSTLIVSGFWLKSDLSFVSTLFLFFLSSSYLRNLFVVLFFFFWHCKVKI